MGPWGGGGGVQEERAVFLDVHFLNENIQNHCFIENSSSPSPSHSAETSSLLGLGINKVAVT